MPDFEINEKAFKSELTKVFSTNGLSSMLSLNKVEKFYALTVRMLEENEKYNLTAITEPSKSPSAVIFSGNCASGRRSLSEVFTGFSPAQMHIATKKAVKHT